MRYLIVFALVCCALTTAQAQVDTLQYDGLTNPYDGKLLAITRFPGERQVWVNTRFTPAEKCTLTSVLLGFSVVKFQALTGEDTLMIVVFENSTVPPTLVNIVKTYKVSLGGAGFPSPNIRFDHPLESGARDVLAVQLEPPVIISPRRDFIVGVRLEAKQQYAVGEGVWNGLSMLINPNITEYERYQRYYIAPNPKDSKSALITVAANAGVFMRAVVSYNPDLPDVDPNDVAEMPLPLALELQQNYPNPFNPSTVIEYAVPMREHITLTVHDALGRVVSVLADGMIDAGLHSTQFSAENLPAGMYIARLTVNGQVRTRSMLLLK